MTLLLYQHKILIELVCTNNIKLNLPCNSLVVCVWLGERGAGGGGGGGCGGEGNFLYGAVQGCAVGIGILFKPGMI